MLSADNIATCVAQAAGRYQPTDDFMRSLGLHEETDHENGIQYLYNGETVDTSSACMVVGVGEQEVLADNFRRIALLRTATDAEEGEQPTTLFWGFVPDEETLRVIIACTQWLAPVATTPR